MNKLLLFLMLSIPCYCSALIMPMYGFEGSVLCEDLKVGRYLPDSLQGHDFISSSVALSDTSNDIFISYYFESSNVIKERPRTIWTNLNEDLLKESYKNLDIFWGVYEIYNLDGKQITESPVYYFSGVPATECYEAKKDCPNIKIYRKSIRSECEKSRYVSTRLYHNIIGDSVFVEFKDSVVSPVVVCMAENLYIHTDSGVVSGLIKQKYELIESDTFKLCLNFTCETLYLENDLISFVDLSDCLVASEALETKSSIGIPYPNPAKEAVRIPGFSGVITLTDQLGKTYHLDGDEQFNVSAVPPGLYVLSFVMDGTHKTEKLLVSE